MAYASKTNIYLRLFTPSGLGAVIYTFVAGLVIVLHQFSNIEQYLQLPGDLQLMQRVLNWLDHLLTSVIGQSTTEAVVVGLFWAVVGLGVYVFLQGVARFFIELGEGFDRRSYVWPKGTDRNRPVIEAAERIVFRIMAFIGLVVIVFGPLAKAMAGRVFVDAIGPSNPLQLAVWFVVLWLLIHLCIVLVRLIALKPRLFD